ncbi:MAG: SAM-dependent methyltransferase [Chloroflexota bacterium]
MQRDTWIPEDIPLDKPNVARMYDFYLGGYHNFAIDRQAAEAVIATYPDFPIAMRANRAFLQRAVRFLAAEGIHQFLDIGSGIPTVGNVHEVAQRIQPGARVVYVDSDPVAVAHSAAILGNTPNVVALQADARQTDAMLQRPAIRSLLDFDKPVAVLLLTVLHFLTDDREAFETVRTLRAALAPGSYLVVSHGTREHDAPPAVKEQVLRLYRGTSNPAHPRSRADIARFFEDFDLVEPGLVHTPLWRPNDSSDPLFGSPERSATYAGVARKPATATGAAPETAS